MSELGIAFVKDWRSLAATAGGLAGAYLFLPPHYTFAKPLAVYANLLFYALTCALTSLLVHALHRTAWRLLDALREIEAHRDRLEWQGREHAAKHRVSGRARRHPGDDARRERGGSRLPITRLGRPH